MINTELRILSVLVTITFIGTIIYLLKSGRLKENFCLIWILFCIFTALVTFNFNIVRKVADVAGFDDPNNALFFFSILFLIFSILVASIEISCLYKHVTKLIQQVSILNEKLHLEPEEKEGPSEKA